MTDRHLPASHAAIFSLPRQTTAASSLASRVVLRGALLLASAATQPACGGPDFSIGASSSTDAGPDGETPDVDNNPIIICNPCSPDPTADAAGDAPLDATGEALRELDASDATAEHRPDAAGAEAGVTDATVDATIDASSGDASFDVAADHGLAEEAGPFNPVDAAPEAGMPVCAGVAEGSPCGDNKICHDILCVECDGTSCPAGCCSTRGCVTAAQSTSECGVGVGGAACTACPAPSGGTGGATCSGNVCAVSCTAPTPNLCGAACVNLPTDVSHCGTCNTVCQPGGQCVSGACSCPAGTKSCGSACAPCSTQQGALPTCNGTTCSFTCDAANGYTACGNSCSLLQTDANNCGACGHGCLGGACVSGQCQPLTVADGLAGYVFGLGIDSTNIYFTTGAGGQVGLCPLGGCGAAPTYIKSGMGFAGYLTYVPSRSTLLVSDPNNGVIYSLTTGGVINYTITGLALPAYTATDGNFLWWAEQARIGFASLANGANVLTFVGTPSGQPFGLWFDSATDDLFAAVNGGPGEALECTIGEACTHVSSPSYFNTTVILVQGATMYFGARGTPANNYADGGLFSAPVNNPTNVTALAVGPNYAFPLSMTADSSVVYFFSFQSANIYKCGLAGCGGAPTEIAASQVEVPAMVNDAQYVYWGGNGHVLKVAK